MPPRTRRIRGNAHGWMLRRGRRDARAMHARDAGRDALAGWISGVAACVDRDVAAAGGISPTAAMARRVLPQIEVGKPLCRRSALGRDRFAVIGRASCRASVGTSVEISVGDVYLKKKKK